MKVLITGSNGQLGKALGEVFEDSVRVDSDELDITDRSQVISFDISKVGAIINSAAYTKVDVAEEPTSQALARVVNTEGVANLAEIAACSDIPLVHISTDYVFDGTKLEPYTETDQPNTTGIYGLTKAAGDVEAAKPPKYYIFRTSMVIGDGPNFVRAILGRARQNLPCTVVNDQVGRLTFTDTLASAVKFALENKIPYGLYNLTNDGEPDTWFEAAKLIYTHSGHDPGLVSAVTTKEYFKNHEFAAPRPANSTLDLAKIKGQGFTPDDWKSKLREYVTKEMEKV